MRSRRPARTFAAVAAALLAATAVATAEERQLSAEEVVRLALVTSPTVALAEQEVASRAASLQRAEGVFDPLIGTRSQFDYALEELVGSRLRAEQDRRLRLEIPPPILDDAAQKLIDRLPIDSSLLFPGSCANATAFVFLGETETILCLDDDGNLLAVINSNLGLDPSIFGTISLLQAFEGLEGLDERLQTFVGLLQATAADQMRIVALILRRTANSVRFQRLRLGDVPEDRESIRWNTAIDHRHLFRNGTALVSTMSFLSTEENFRGKQLNPTLGDSLLPNTFTFQAGVALDLPLGRGGGRTSAEAPVRAAEKGLEAAQALLEQTASERALAALEAYWDAVAAERRIGLLEDSRRIQEELLGAAEELVEADVVARVDLFRNRAQLADVEANLASACQARDVAFANLVRVLGLDAAELAGGLAAAEGLDAWIQADPFADVDPEAIAAAATAARDDLRAAGSAVEANRTLAEAARVDLRPEVALSLNLSYNAFHETYSERFFDPEGFEKAIDGVFAGPSYGMSLRFRFPIGNNAARGRLLQAESATVSSEIDAIDLERSIRLRVLELRASLDRARAELDAQRENLAAIEETQAATLERFRFGDLSVLDTLITERELTGARLDVLDAERRWLSLVARLRFEIGALIALDRDRPVAEARLVALDAPVT